MAPMSVLLLRHAESEWNRIGRWQGTEDPPLSDAGRRDAAQLAPVLGRFGAIWTSPLSRARETATIIGSALDAAPVQIDARLVEVHFADWQGLNVDEIDARWPGLRASGRRPRGAESDDAVSTRAMAALSTIAGPSAAADGPILVVTHGGLIRTVCRHLGHPTAAPANLGGVWLTGADGDWRVSDIWHPDLASAGDSL
jgi:broad specificity phosphatase PhoE